jgi:hypothetical protein
MTLLRFLSRHEFLMLCLVGISYVFKEFGCADDSCSVSSGLSSLLAKTVGFFISDSSSESYSPFGLRCLLNYELLRLSNYLLLFF